MTVKLSSAKRTTTPLPQVPSKSENTSNNTQTTYHASTKCRERRWAWIWPSACDASLLKGQCLIHEGDAEKYGLLYSTLRDQLNGAQDRKSSRERIQLFTKQEQTPIIQWCNHLHDWGFELKITLLNQMAGHFIQKHAGQQTLRKHGLKHFLDWNPELGSRFSSRLDRQPALASNHALLRDYIKNVSLLVFFFSFIKC